MSAFIFNADGTVSTEDRWQLGGEVQPAAAGRNVMLPLDHLLARPTAHPAPPPLGVWLRPTDDPALLQPWINRLSLIAIEFPKAADGRGYSIAALLRSRYGYRGELRAIGEVAVDQLWFLQRVGFSSFALHTDADPAAVAAALNTFSDAYQGAAREPLPAYRRHHRRAAPAAA